MVWQPCQIIWSFSSTCSSCSFLCQRPAFGAAPDRPSWQPKWASPLLFLAGHLFFPFSPGGALPRSHRFKGNFFPVGGTDGERGNGDADRRSYRKEEKRYDGLSLCEKKKRSWLHDYDPVDHEKSGKRCLIKASQFSVAEKVRLLRNPSPR